MKKKHLGDESV
jgi:tetratricopeptide (TPR) repeat protein